MAAAHLANVTIEQDETRVPLPSGIPLQAGPVPVERHESGSLVTKRSDAAVKGNPWTEFFTELAASPPDDAWSTFLDTMLERPCKRLPVERDLFGEG